jgi:hypothetical protein
MDHPQVILAISLFFINEEGQFYCLLLAHSNLPDKIEPTNLRPSQTWHMDFLTRGQFSFFFTVTTD